MGDRSYAEISVGGTMNHYKAHLVAKTLKQEFRPECSHMLPRDVLEEGRIWTASCDEASGGMFDDLECRLIELRVPFDRQSAPCWGVWDGETRFYRPAEEKRPRIDQTVAEGSYDPFLTADTLHQLIREHKTYDDLVAAISEALGENICPLEPIHILRYRPQKVRIPSHLKRNAKTVRAKEEITCG